MPNIPMFRYEVQLSITVALSGAAHELHDTIRRAVGVEISPGQVTIESITEVRSPDALAVETIITPLAVLIAVLPAELITPCVRAALAEAYHRELSCLWRSVRDNRCIRPLIRLGMWRIAGSQRICEFASLDRGAPLADTYNFHLQNTSQWRNEETGWLGHQGAIVIDTETGEVSAHH